MKNVSLHVHGMEEAEQIIKNNEHHNKDTGLLEMAIRQHNKYRVKRRPHRKTAYVL